MNAKSYTKAFKIASKAVDMFPAESWESVVLVNTLTALREEAVREGFCVIHNHAQERPYWVG
jgi:hypothetical protein